MIAVWAGELVVAFMALPWTTKLLVCAGIVLVGLFVFHAGENRW